VGERRLFSNQNPRLLSALYLIFSFVQFRLSTSLKVDRSQKCMKMEGVFVLFFLSPLAQPPSMVFAISDLRNGVIALRGNGSWRA
jgi:hypothetical protein